MTTALVIGAVVLALLVIIYGIYRAAEHAGRVAERNSILEEKITNEKERLKIDEDVKRMSDDELNRELSKHKRSLPLHHDK